MKKTGVIFIALLSCGFLISVFAAEAVSAALKQTSNKAETGYSSQAEGQSLKKWQLKEEDEKVQKALDVFKNKGKSLRNKKVWIIDKQNGEKKILIEYSQSGKGSGLVFTPEEDFVIYTRSDSEGSSVVYWKDLSSGSQYSVSNAAGFNFVECSKNKRYVVIEKDLQGKKSYYLYDLKGQKVRDLTAPFTAEDMKKAVCY